ncbi:MAG TPA: methylated-DNA--[protein]-cysteine S-methyltransferase [Acidimicrobiia bacterium]|jgi:O-6-methylguanine DNA methyltransferase|nr:methylated-DNA--[protein]-cysteine S-methyltransferase [Acidimicrobiia bacterium]
MTREQAQVDTPIGMFRAVVIDGFIRTAGFVDRRSPSRATRDTSGVHDVLSAYFAGDIDALDTLAVAPQGTEFRQRVWKELREIRAGSTISYGELAARVGAPGAARAVGTANATNPICLVIPCHRVVRAGGALGGYGFGVDRKRWLLGHETRPAGLFARPARRSLALTK